MLTTGARRVVGRSPLGAAILAGTMLAAGCGQPASTGTSVVSAPGAGIGLTPPAGWSEAGLSGADGLVVAASSADLRASVPTGPRLTVRPSPATAADPAALVAAVDKAPFEGVPTANQAVVGGRAAASLTWSEAQSGVDHTYELVVVSLGSGRAVTFLLESTSRAWGSDQSRLEAILKSVQSA